MKKLVLLVSALLLVSQAQSQSLQINTTKSDTVAYGHATNTIDIPSYVYVKNISSNSLDVLVKRIDKNYNELTDSNAICWVICFATDVSVAPGSTAITLQPNQETFKTDFVGHVYPDQDGVPRSGSITYVFFDANNPSDSVAHTVRYEVNATFDVDEFNDSPTLSVYPNPAKDELTLEYDLSNLNSATFQLVNVLGNIVYEKELSSINSNTKLDISRLARGVYFYVLRSNGEALATRKLVVE